VHAYHPNQPITAPAPLLRTLPSPTHSPPLFRPLVPPPRKHSEQAQCTATATAPSFTSTSLVPKLLQTLLRILSYISSRQHHRRVLFLVDAAEPSPQPACDRGQLPPFNTKFLPLRSKDAGRTVFPAVPGSRIRRIRQLTSHECLPKVLPQSSSRLSSIIFQPRKVLSHSPSAIRPSI
jgi:hypothetical protein